jgi:RNA polymerase sigma-54 factor
MVRLMEILVDIQEDFIRHGDMNIVPITRAQISRELDVHESTISRAVSNKTVMLPNRKVIPLSAFFDRSLNVRTIIKDLVRDEKKPLTDQKIVELLDDMGIDIARRTVAKYRAMEGILPAHMRNAISQRI